VKGEEGSSRRSRLWIEEGRSSSSRSKTRVEVEPLRGSRDKAANLASLKSQGGGSNAWKGLKEENFCYIWIFLGVLYIGVAPHCKRTHDMYGGDLSVFLQHCIADAHCPAEIRTRDPIPCKGHWTVFLVVLLSYKRDTMPRGICSQKTQTQTQHTEKTAGDLKVSNISKRKK
jgi:hypothetical protein